VWLRHEDSSGKGKPAPEDWWTHTSLWNRCSSRVEVYKSSYQSEPHLQLLIHVTILILSKHKINFTFTLQYKIFISVYENCFCNKLIDYGTFIQRFVVSLKFSLRWYLIATTYRGAFTNAKYSALHKYRPPKVMSNEQWAMSNEQSTDLLGVEFWRGSAAGVSVAPCLAHCFPYPLVESSGVHNVEGGNWLRYVTPTAVSWLFTISVVYLNVTETRTFEHVGLHSERCSAPYPAWLHVHSAWHWSGHQQADGWSLQVSVTCVLNMLC
jgi:hypothetical protein